MSETFPEDVMEAAVLATAGMSHPDATEVTEAIATAILAERERCAKIAEPLLSELWVECCSDTAERIAAAIRGTNA